MTAERFQGMVAQASEASDRNATVVNVWNRYPNIHRLLVHKLNGQRETFDLNRLEADENCQHYSKLLKTTILAKDLLARSYRGMAPDQSLLIQDMVECCTDVQANRNPYENPRNTYVRDILRAKHYYVCDQTLCRKSEGQNEAGELDMEIRRDAGMPWTIFEALNHSDYDTWKRHLDKLLTNYNPYRLKMLFLVVYVDNKKFDSVVDHYKTLLRTHAPTDIKCIGESAEEITDIFVGDAGGIKVWRCNYESGIGSMTVYHFFAHMDKPIEPNPPKKSSTTSPSK